MSKARDMKWQPIESAPKDVELLGALRGCDSGRYIIRTVEKVCKDDHEWESEGFEISNCWDVTHWMPLPEPPEDETGEG